jgi:hypothetical protein
MLDLSRIKKYVDQHGFQIKVSGNIGEYSLWVYEYDGKGVHIEVRAQVYITNNGVDRVRTDVLVDKAIWVDNEECKVYTNAAVDLAQMFRDLLEEEK